MAKELIAVRLFTSSRHMLQELMQRLDTSQTDVIERAIRVLYDEEGLSDSEKEEAAITALYRGSEPTICPLCKGRINTANYSVIPNGTIIHANCPPKPKDT